MEKFFHLQRLLKSLADGVWSLLLPQTTVASLSITDDWWETQHILFSLRPVQGEWRRIWFKDLQTLVDCDKLQPPLSLLLALQAATGSHRRGSAHARLCCRPQLTQVLLTSVPGTTWAVLEWGAIATCSQNMDLCQVPTRKQHQSA